MENTLLNLIPAAYLPEIHLSQYDVGRTITFTLKDGASDYSVPSGASVKVKATKPSGFGFEVACTFNGGTVTLVTTDTMTPENGRFPAELSIVSGNTTIGTSNFIFNIERSPHPEGTIDGDAETIIPELTLLVERIEDAADSVDEDTQTVTEAKAEVLQAKADTLQAKADTLSARDESVSAKDLAVSSAQTSVEASQRAEQLVGSVETKADAIVKTASGDIASFTDGGDDLPMKSLKVNIVPKQSGSGDPSPSNVRPISGYEGVNVYDDSAYGGIIEWNQLIPIAGSSKTKTESNVTITDNRDGSYTVQTTQDGASADVNLTLTGAVTSKGGHVGILYGCPSGGYVNNSVKYRLWDAWGGIGNDYGNGCVGKWVAGGQFEIRISVASGTVITTPIKFVPQLFDLTQMFGSQVADYIYSLESAETGKGVAFFKSLFPNDYYPYNAGEETVVGAVNGDPYRHYPISLGQTVYGGTLDVVSGVLTIDRASIDMGNTTWIYGNGGFYANMSTVPITPKALFSGICSCYKYGGAYNVCQNNQFGYIFNSVPYVKDSRYTDASTFKTAMSGQTMVVELATPIEVALTPTQVTTLLGDNNIWANSGSVEVEYRADTTLAYNKLLSAIASLS